MTRLEWTNPAVADLENIQDYVARDSPEYAAALIERLILSVDRLTASPKVDGWYRKLLIRRCGSCSWKDIEWSIGSGRAPCPLSMRDAALTGLVDHPANQHEASGLGPFGPIGKLGTLLYTCAVSLRSRRDRPGVCLAEESPSEEPLMSRRAIGPTCVATLLALRLSGVGVGVRDHGQSDRDPDGDSERGHAG